MMRKILSIAISFLFIASCAGTSHAALTSGSPVIGSGGLCRDGNGVISACVSTDSFVLGNISSTGTHNIVPNTVMANIHYAPSPGVYQNLSTPDVWYDGITYDSATTFGNISASTDGTITFLEDGDYLILADNSLRVTTGVVMTQGIFKNAGVADSFSREMTKGPDRLPTFRSISSDGSDATYDTYSTLSYLYYADKDVIQFQEGDTGATGCFYVNISYSEVDIPHLLVLNNTMYNGGVGHYGDVQAWDGSSWINLRTATSDFADVGGDDDYRKQNTRWVFPGNREDFVINGVVKIRIVHNDAACNPAHLFIIDETYIIDRLNSIPFPSHHEGAFVAGDVISIKFMPDTGDSDMIKDHVDLTVIKIGQ